MQVPTDCICETSEVPPAGVGCLEDEEVLFYVIDYIFMSREFMVFMW